MLILEPDVYGDNRGFFMESWNKQTFQEVTGIETEFVQDNHSRSSKYVLRGLHYQIQHPQGKLMRVVCGSVFDVAVDLRKSSCDFGKWVGVELSEDNQRQLWIPPGFAHGFLIMSDYADFLYKTTDYYAPEYERVITWCDPDINIKWPIGSEPKLSAKDKQVALLADADLFH